MKTVIRSIVFLIIISQCTIRAEVFIGPSAPTNRFVLATGQVAMISGIYPKFLYDTNGIKTGSEAADLGASIATSTETNNVYMGECKEGLTALAGPLELVISNSVAITYRIISNTSIQSPVIKPGSTNLIQIPNGKTLHFLTFGIDGYKPLLSNVYFIKGATTFPGYDIYGGAEFDGPLTIGFVYPLALAGAPPKSFTLPYYITDQAAVLPDQVALQSPTGNFEIQLQKSTDLANWYPAVVLPRSSDGKAFYRVRIAK